ncbi:MAG: hypothetical protein FJ086_07865 [Deltaproteobacteria bacterium]|nr:hypothetical protein [Deltaproteobacteria bacterium]
MLTLVSTLLLAAAPPAPLVRAVAEAAPAGLRAEVTSFDGRLGSCRPLRASLKSTLEGSGRYAARVDGNSCGAWGWAEVKVYGRAAVALRALQRGDPLDGAVQYLERPVRRGEQRVEAVAEGAVAARAISAGEPLTPAALSLAGPLPGERVEVVVRMGALEVKQPAVVVPCVGIRLCARLPSGRKVEGRYVPAENVLEVTP